MAIAKTAFEDLVQDAVEIIAKAEKDLERYHGYCQQRLECDEADIRWQGLRLQLRADATKILQWQSLWLPDAPPSPDFGVALWGSRGEAELRKVLEQVIACASETTVARNPRDEDSLPTKNRSTSKYSQGWWEYFSPPVASSPYAQDSNRQSELDTDIANIYKSVTELTTKVTELSERAELLFRSLHAALPGSNAQKDHLENVLATRKVSKVVYDLCRTCSQTVDLDMNLLNNEEEFDKLTDVFDWWRDLKLTYRLSVTNDNVPNAAKRIILQSVNPGERDTAVLGCEKQDEASVLDISSPPAKGWINISSIQGSSDLTECSFLVETSRYDRAGIALNPTSQMLEQKSWMSLFSFLRRGLSLSTRASWAYQVVECGLILLDTPYIQHLSSDNLRLTNFSSRGSQLWLRLDVSTMEQKSEQSRTGELSTQLQLIGILLVEIALETRMGHQQFDDSQFEAEQLAKVGKQMGSLYQQACEFCLQRRINISLLEANSITTAKSSSNETVSEENFSAYYNEVFIRIREVWHSLSLA